MTKIRVYELAKELEMESKDVIRRLGKMGADAKNHMSTVDDKHADMLREIMRPKLILADKERANGPNQKKHDGDDSGGAEHAKAAPAAEHKKDASMPKPAATAEEKQKTEAPPSPKAEVKTEISGAAGHKPQKNTAEPTAADSAKPAPAEAAVPREETKAAESHEQPATKPQETQGRGDGYKPHANNRQNQGQEQSQNRNQGQHQNRGQGQGQYQNRGQGQGQYQNRGQNQGQYQNRGQGQGQYQNRGQGQGQYQNRGQGQGQYQNRGQGQGQYQNRGQGQGQYQNRGQGQGQYQNRGQGQGQYQNRGQGQGQYQNRGQGQGQYQNRGQGQGQYQNRGQSQGQYQNRGQGQGQYQNRGQGQGQYQNRGQGQGQYQNRGQGQGQYQNRGQGQGQYQNRGQGQGQYQNRGQGQGQYQNRGQGQGQYQNRGQGQRPADLPKPIETKKEPRRFEQKKKSPYESKKRDNELRNNYDSNGNLRRRPNHKQKRRPKVETPPPVTPKTVVIGESVIISELAKSMGKTAAELIKKLMLLGTMATVNQEVDAETAQILAGEFGVTVEIKVDKTMEIMEDDTDDEATLVKRPPVVTVMGHVDHGKTSLLDAIRKTNVIAHEAGGITQHIGAYQVEISGQKITFLDTPGHEAFTSMRARGAQATDIAILVVAADDGVMPQTIEAINHAKAAEVPIIVAINKIDKEGADVNQIKSQLTEYGLVPEEWGGSTIMAPISAKKGEGIQNLLEMILLVAEIEDFKSNPDRNARGTILEAELDKGRGAVATVLVQKGTLRVGDILVAGTVFARVRAMIDDKGRRIKAALPSTPVEILGFSDVPPPGEVFVCVDDEKDARHIAGHNALNKREKEMGGTAKVSLDDLFKQISEGIVKDLNIVVKADVQGSIEALIQSIKTLSTDEVRVNIIHSGVGGIAESDVMLAAASNAIIIGFNVRPDANTKKAAEREGVDIRMYRVIYEALDDIKAAMSGLLDPEFKEVVIGHIEVRNVFKVPKVGLVAGCYVLDGKVTRNAKIRLLRNSIVIHEGNIASLRRFKDDVKEVVSGYECGLGIENFNDVKIDDQMEAYIMEETKRTI